MGQPSFNYDVTEATTGAEALKRLDAGEFDLMICDLGLPELSGLHLARWVKEFRPDLPVIIATGFAEMIAEDDYHKARIDDVISKPYALSDVLLRANTILARHAVDHRETMTVYLTEVIEGTAAGTNPSPANLDSENSALT